MQFSILNQSPLLENHSVQESLAHTTELAKKADALGYRRYFVSEHHNMDHIIGTSPEVLVTHLLSQTKRIKVGCYLITTRFMLQNNFNSLVISHRSALI